MTNEDNRETKESLTDYRMAQEELNAKLRIVTEKERILDSFIHAMIDMIAANIAVERAEKELAEKKKQQ